MKRKHLLIRSAAILAIVLLALYFTIKYVITGNIDADEVQIYINSYGSYGAVIFVLIFSLRALFIIFPYSLMVVIGGSLFGNVNGYIYSLIAVFISANIAFFIGRYAGKDIVQGLLRGKMKKLDLKIEQHGFKIILLMRVSIIFPYDILSYAAGVSQVKYKDFILGTMLGMLPETFSLTYLGNNLDNPFSKEFVLAVVLVLLTVAVPFVYSKVKKKDV